MCGSVVNNWGMWVRGVGVFWGCLNFLILLIVGGDGGGF